MLHSYKGNEKVVPLNYKYLDSLPCNTYRASILPENLAYLDSIITLSRNKGAQICFVISPTYYKGAERINNLHEHLDRFRRYASEHKVPLFDYSHDSLCYQKELFADFYHMKGEGCDVFTKKFSEEYKRESVR